MLYLVYLLLLVLELLGEAVGLALQALCLALVHGGLAHAGALTVGVGVVHLSLDFKLQIINQYSNHGVCI